MCQRIGFQYKNLFIYMVFMSLPRHNLHSATPSSSFEALHKAATPYIMEIGDIPNLHKYRDVERGAAWYDYRSDTTDDDDSDIKSQNTGEKTSSLSDDHDSKSSGSSDASSRETKEKVMHKKLYRNCVPCAGDMLKKYTNIGIKWICGGYQRARRTFKSECMMRYRNCQDGTLFVKLYDHRCKNDTYHGKHWFYIYKV